tara:strand:- start:1224 stop:2801 length:1578 start_codon:yes stop_codon:yes gene_type:complete
MAERINEDIRFYLPADPYYYQVDNLPLRDLLDNDIKLQDQIDALTADSTSVVRRDGIRELQPFIDTALPGTVSVRQGNFIGRVQRTAGAGLPGSTVDANGDGIFENNTPPTTDDNYSVSNPPNQDNGAAAYVGRTSVFNFPGGNISIDGFDFNGFNLNNEVTPPLGRVDLIGITTVNGAMDDPYLPGNPTGTGVDVGDGTPKLAVVKGAGIVTASDQRELIVGEKYITIGIPQMQLNDYGRNLEGEVVPNPEFGTVPSPDDVVNICFSDPEVNGTLADFANNNKNASFFLPLAYVFVPQSHVAGNPIPTGNLKDIRPFLRTAELTLGERQAIARSYQPSISNRMVTESHMDDKFKTEIDRTTGSDTIQGQIDNLNATVGAIQIPRFLNLQRGGQVKSTYVTSNSQQPLKVYLTSILNNNSAQLANIPTDTIRQVQLTVYNNLQTGDVSYTTLRARGEGMSNYMRVYGHKLDNSGTTNQLGPANTFSIVPIRDNNGELYVEFYRTGSNIRFGIELHAITYNESVQI